VRTILLVRVFPREETIGVELVQGKSKVVTSLRGQELELG
jgi:hypothetical protein